MKQEAIIWYQNQTIKKQRFFPENLGKVRKS